MRQFSQLAILVLLFAALAGHVQNSRSAASDKCANESASEGNPDEPAADYEIGTNSAWSSRLRAGFGLLRRMDEGVIRAFEQAWVISGCGSNSREGVVLIFLMEDGSYRGKSLGFRNEYKEFRFTWNPGAVAVVHTHPNNCDPSPSEQDKRVAEKYDVPMFTITVSGMYVYDPATTVTSRVLQRLDWLKPSKWTEGVYRTVIAELFGEANKRGIPIRPLKPTIFSE